MNKRCRELNKKNTQAELMVLPENEEAYTNIICYLRVANISEYHQELVRQDILNMVLEGQERGAGIENIIGDDYKAVCDDIIAELPREKWYKHAADVLEIGLGAAIIIGIIRIATILLLYVVGKRENLSLEVSAGDLFLILMCVAVGYGVVYYICRNAFVTEISKGRKRLIFIGFLCVLTLLFAVCFLAQEIILFQIPFAVGIIILAVFWGVKKGMNYYI